MRTAQLLTGVTLLVLLTMNVAADPAVAWTAQSANTTFHPTGHSATYVHSSGSVWVLGGVSQADVGVSHTSLQLYLAELDVSGGANPVATTVREHVPTQVAPLRTGHVAVSHPTTSNRLLVWGGDTGAGVLSDLVQMNTATRTWTVVSQGGSQPPGRAYASWTRVCIPDTRTADAAQVAFSAAPDATADSCGANRSPVLVLFGGITASDGTSASNGIDVMRGNETGTWMSGATVSGAAPAARSRHTATVVDKKHGSIVGLQCVLIFGGVGPAPTSTIYGDLWELCPDLPTVADGQAHDWDGKWVWRQITDATGTAPVLRYDHAATTLGATRMVVFGGRNDDFPNDFHQDTHLYDSTLNQWFTLESTTTPSARAGMSMSTVYDSATGVGEIIIVGGRDRYSALAEVHVGTITVELCSAGSASPTGHNANCSACDPGSWSLAGAYDCTPCSPGSYATGSGTTTCTLCGAGKYSTVVGSVQEADCTLCGSGTFTASEGGASSAVCANCDAGTYSAADRASCPDCASGRYSGSAGAGSCQTCLAGTYSTGGASECTDCDPGWHQPDAEKDVCFRCPSGTYSDAAASSCEACSVGTYRSSPGGAGASSCSDCVAGKYSSQTGTVICTDCPAGRAHNQVRATALSVCSACNPGFYAASAGASLCQPCPAGTYSNSTGASSCFDCDKGTYSEATAAISSATCQTCPNGLSTAGTGAAAASECLSCNPGFYRDNTTELCLSCPPGTSSSATSIVRSIAACSKCGSSSHASSFASTSCSACDSQSVSYNGWSRCAPCDYQGHCASGPNSVLCSGHGTCEFGHCTCESGWSGADCSAGTCVSCQGSVMFDTTELRVVEGDSITITVLRTLGTTGAAVVDVEINSDHVNNTGSNVDIGGASPITLSFADGETSKTLTITATDDSVQAEGCETVVLALTPVTAGVTTIGEPLFLVIEDVNVPAYMQSSTAGSGLVTPTAAAFVLGSDNANLQVNVTVPTSITTPLDFMLLQDLSGSYNDDITRLRALLANLVSSVQVENPDTYFGVGSFIDTPTSPFGYAGEYSYQTDLALTPNSVVMQEVVNNLVVKSGRDFPESQLWALLMSAKRITEVGWREGSRRVVVLATDATAHEHPEGVSGGLTANNGDGVFDGGDGAEAYPSRQQVKDALVEAGIVPIFTVTTSALSYYQTLVDNLGFGTVVTLDSNSDNVVEAVLAGMAAIEASVSLFAASGASRVGTISPASYSDVAGQTVTFDVQLLGCGGCARGSSEDVILSIPLYGQVAVTLTHSIDQCSVETEVEQPLAYGWAGWIQRDRAGPGVTLNGLPDTHSGEVNPVIGAVPWWVGSGSVELVPVSAAGTVPTNEVLETALHLTSDGATSAVATQEFTVDFGNVLPIVIRSYVKANGVSGGASGTDFAMTITVDYTDGSREAEVAYLDFPTGSYDFEHFTQLFQPRSIVAGVIVSVHMRNGVSGEAWVAGTGVAVVPTAACSCDRGFYATIGSSVGAGMNVDLSAISGAAGCSRCPLGFACSGSSVQACPTGKYSYGGFATCQDCLPGRTCINGTIAPCPVGWYLSANETCSICEKGYACSSGLRTQCPAGFYTHQLGMEYCLPCLPGTVSNTTGARECFTCEAGSASNFGNTQCTHCQHGETSVAGGVCATCPRGTYSPTAGHAECTPCPVGKYSSSVGVRACVNCPDGTSTAGTSSTSLTDCVP